MLLTEAVSRGKCITRNGEFNISAVRIELARDGMARIGFVSGRLKRDLHAGALVEASAMDRLAMQWLEKRGLGTVRDLGEEAKRALAFLAEAKQKASNAEDVVRGMLAQEGG